MKTEYGIQVLRDIINDALKKLDINDNNNLTIEKIKNKEYGDYATNIALFLAKKNNQNPEEIALQIIKEIKKNTTYIKKVTYVKPGFINITVNNKFITKIINQILEKQSDYGKGKPNNIKYNIEIVSANPTGPLHIGHGRNGAIGDSSAKIMRFAGYDVKVEYYINDAGNQINTYANSIFTYYLKNLNIECAFPEESYQGEEQEQIAKLLIEKYNNKFIDYKIVDNILIGKDAESVFKKEAVYMMLNIIKQQLKTFRVDIEHWSSEAEMYHNNAIDKLLKRYQKLNYLYKKDNALWLKTTDFGDDKDRVLVKSDGTYTYILPDLACHDLRIQRTNADYLVNVWGGDHHGYIKRMSAGLAILGHRPNILEIDIIQMVRLVKDGKEYKMSKRKGTAVWLMDVINELGVDVVRYMLSSKNASSHMELDISLLKKDNQKNPVFYLQYATARCQSLLKKIKQLDWNIDNTPLDFYDLLGNDKEKEIVKELDNFYLVVQLAAKLRQPSVICDYLQLIARLFHSYYAKF
ncbi:MAG: arginine--tRNA ligase, partial [Mycoplasma sp.]|nr:arginine--tRNA ligase [Mycoplasma sp.]